MGFYNALCDTAALIRTANQYLRETAQNRAARDADPSAAGSAMLGVTSTDGNYPTNATSVYVVTPQELDADDSEGATSTPTSDDTQNVYAVNLGTAVPPMGTQVVCHAVGGRWTFRYDG